MAFEPYIGQHIVLNSEGIRTLVGHRAEALGYVPKPVVVTYVENLGYDDDPIWRIEVDCPIINSYLIDSSLFDPVT